MEDSFRVRVEKVFGSLLSSSNQRSLWSLTDDEIERRERNCDKGSLEPELELGKQPNGVTVYNHVDFHNEMEKDLEELGDVDGDGDDDGDIGFESRGSRASLRPDDFNEEEWEVKCNIGMDCTLDYEEENDEYDLVATGKEIDCKMNDYVDDYGIEDDSCNELPNSLKDIIRDPRANHLAAKLRLKEDAEAAEKISSLWVTENGASLVDPQLNAPEDGNPKSILKKRDTQAELKSHKRVRFDPECRKECVESSEGAKCSQMETCVIDKIDNSNEATLLPQDHPSSGVPDYVRNPSKYTHYTFDPSDDLDERNNQQAYMDFLKLLERSNTVDSQPDNTSDGLLKSVSFVPKKKIDHVMMLDNGSKSKQNWDATGKEFVQSSSRAVGIAACDPLDSEVCAMDEDEQDIPDDERSNSKRSGRKYRTKARLEIERP